MAVVANAEMSGLIAFTHVANIVSVPGKIETNHWLLAGPETDERKNTLLRFLQVMVIDAEDASDTEWAMTEWRIHEGF